MSFDAWGGARLAKMPSGAAGGSSNGPLIAIVFERWSYLAEVLIAAAALRVLLLISAANVFWSGVRAGARASDAKKKTNATVAAHFHSDGLLKT